MFNIQEELKKLPEKPGVYIMKDKDDKILYVGKAVILKNRVRQYFQKNNKSTRIEKMVSLIDHFEYIVVDSEMEALILECNLIKLHRPKYNVLLKDDKMYPYIKITVNDDFPTVKTTRKKLDDGAKYYGPYTNGYAVKQTVDFVNKIYKLKQCNKIFKNGKEERACLNYHIKKCVGVCQHIVSKEEYRSMINQVMMFLEGKTGNVIKNLEEQMQIASDNQDYEKAAELRDKRISIENLIQKQKMDNFSENDIDVIGAIKVGSKASVEVFFIRNSKTVGGENFILYDVEDMSEGELICTFMKQFYNKDNVPSKIMFRYDFDGIELVKDWLLKISERKSIEFKIPQKGEKLRFIEMAEENAKISLQNKANIFETENILVELKDILELPELPRRIESYDISNISGTNTVAGIIVFVDGKPRKGEYRRIKIKTVEGQNDIGCMKETLERRLKYLVDNTLKSPYGPMPNLILMDGGINQLNVAKSVLNDMDLAIPVCGMVKNDNHKTRAIINGLGTEIDISQNKNIFNLITQIQDEVHNTALEYHRKLRDKLTTKSALDDIPGIGEKKKRLLIKQFKSVEKIKQASVDDLTKVEGINAKLANEIKAKLNS